MVSREEYNSYVRELLKGETENTNVKYLKKGYASKGGISIAFAVLSLFASFVMLIMGNAVGGFLLALGIVLLIFGVNRVINSTKANKYYKNNYREKVIAFLLKDSEYSFNQLGRISERIFEESQFVTHYDDYNGSDKITINIPNDDGSRSDCDLTLCDLIVTKREEDDEGNERDVTVYSGVFGYIVFPFNFKCVLCVDSSYRKRGVKLEKVELEDIHFEKNFKIYSNDQIESRYILTPKMMENLLYLEQRLKGVQITLVDNRMYIGILDVDLFELQSINGDDVSEIFDGFYTQIECILNIVNEIKSNNKVFKM